MIFTKPKIAKLQKMAEQPLSKALENSNAVYRYWRPPLASAVPAVPVTTNAEQRHKLLIVPSEDSLRYELQVRVKSDMSDGITVYCNESPDDAGWSESALGGYVSASAGWNVLTVRGVLLPDTRVLEVVIQPAGAAQILVSHLLLFPEPDEAAAPFTSPTGPTLSGFRVWDTDGLATAGLPVSTEHVDRCGSNTWTTLADRWACVWSYMPWSDTDQFAVTSAGKWNQLARARGYIPKPDRARLYVYALASGNGSIRLQVAGTNKASQQCELTCAAGVLSGTLDLPTEGGDAPVDLELLVRPDEPGDTVVVYAVAALWRPYDDGVPSPLCNDVPAPPAQLSLLQAACETPWRAGIAQPPQPGMAFFGNINWDDGEADAPELRLGVMLGPGELYAQPWVTRCAQLAGTFATQLQTVLATDDSGGATSPYLIGVGCPLVGLEHAPIEGGQCEVLPGSEKQDNSPATDGARALHFVVGDTFLHGDVREVQLQRAAGFGLQVRAVQPVW